MTYMRRSATFWIWPVHAVVLNSQTRSWAQSFSTFAKLETPFFGSRGPKTGFFSGHSRIFCARTKFQLTSLALLSNLYCYLYKPKRRTQDNIFTPFSFLFPWIHWGVFLCLGLCYSTRPGTIRVNHRALRNHRASFHFPEVVRNEL